MTKSPSHLSPAGALMLAAWFGLAGGYLDVAVILAGKHLFNKDALAPYYKQGRFFPWTVPLADLAIMMVPGLLVAGLNRLRPGLISLRLAAGLFAALALWGPLLNLPLYSAACTLLAAGLGRWIGRGVAALGPRPRRWARPSLAGMVGILAVTAAALTGRQAVAEYRAVSRLPVPPPGARNVLLIVLDTVRAESLSLYGYNRETTPQLTRWARRGVRFDRAVAPSCWTFPSHSCFFTGQWPYKLDSHWRVVLDNTYPTLAEFLSSRGYRTAGFVANTSYCSYETGLDHGFAHFEDYSLSPLTILSSTGLGRWVTMNALDFLSTRYFDRIKWVWCQSRDARGINGAFLDWLSRQERGDRPFFAFLNYFDTHEPFLLPQDRATQFGLRPESRSDYQMLKNFWQLDKTLLSPRDVTLARDAYDDCIAYLDQQVGLMLDELDRRGVLQDTVVIITSDHGEEFGEHGVFNHGFSLFLHELLVPLVILSPAAPPGRSVAEAVSLRDLPATVVDLLGVTADSPFPGHSLAAHWGLAAGAAPTTTPALSEVSLSITELSASRGPGPTQWGYAMSMVDGSLHYIRDSEGTEWLYDIASDPQESHNLILSPGSFATLSRFRRSILQVLTDDPVPTGVGEKYVKRYRILLKSLLGPSSALGFL